MSPSLTTNPNHRTIEYPSTGDHLDVDVRNIMTPGVVAISEDTSLRDAYRALIAHSVHAILVVGRINGKPLGWISARGLLDWLTREPTGVYARDAITHEPASIQPTATAREALTAIQQPRISQLIVASRPGVTPQGVVSDVDLIALAAR